MSKNTAQSGFRFVKETTAGTYLATGSSDSDVLLFGGAPVIVNLNNAPLGKLADGSFNDAPLAGGKQAVEIPEFQFPIIAAADEDTAPKFSKFTNAGGWKVVDGMASAKTIVADGTPSCDTLSGDFLNLGCGGKGELITARGIRGSVVIGWDGVNAPILGTFSGGQGAFVARTDVTNQVPYALTGNDTGVPQTAGMYTTTISGVVYQVVTCALNPGNTVSLEPANSLSGIAKAVDTAGEKRVTMTVIRIDTGDAILSGAIARTLFDVTIAGSAPLGATYDILCEDCQIISPSTGDVDGMNAFEIDMICKTITLTPKDVA